MSTAEEFYRLTNQLRNEKPAYVLAELNDLLTSAPSDQIERLPAPSIDDPYLANYVAAMVEQAIHLKGGVRPPRWTAGIQPYSPSCLRCSMDEPTLHICCWSRLYRSAVRNIFIDSSIGDRVCDADDPTHPRPVLRPPTTNSRAEAGTGEAYLAGGTSDVFRVPKARQAAKDIDAMLVPASRDACCRSRGGGQGRPFQRLAERCREGILQ